MFTDKVELKDFEKQDPEYQDLLRRVLAIQADCEIKTWEDYAVFGFLVDRVGRFQLEEFLDCSYLPLARVVEDPDIIREEEGHVDFGTNAAAEFAAKGGESKERIQRAVDYWYVKGLDMFGNSKSYRSERYMFWGLKRRLNAVARQQYKDEI